MTAITQTISTLPNAPDPATDTPAAFSIKAAASVLAQKAMVSELQLWTPQVNTVKAEIDTASGAAATAAETATAQAVVSTAQAIIAQTQAGIATGQATGAAQVLLDVQALYDQFDDRYLGAKTSDPTLDNDGNPLADGAFYVNITPVPSVVRFYSVAGGWVQGVAGVAGVSAINGLSGAVSLKTINGQAITGTGDVVTKTVWVTKTAGTHAVASGASIRADTTTGTVTLTLPASPADDDVIQFKDYAGTFGTNKLIIARNGKNIMGYPQDVEVTENNRSGELTYIVATNDWRF